MFPFSLFCLFHLLAYHSPSFLIIFPPCVYPLLVSHFLFSYSCCNLLSPPCFSVLPTSPPSHCFLCGQQQGFLDSLPLFFNVASSFLLLSLCKPCLEPPLFHFSHQI